MVRWFEQKSRLTQMIDKPGGTTVRRIVQQIDAQIDPLRPEGMDVIDFRVAELEGATAARGGDEAAWLRDIYRLSSQVLDIAGPLGLADISKASLGLCDLADRFSNAGRADLASIQVHVHALRLLVSNPGLDEAARAEILSGLVRVVERIPKRG
jgi:hypothetical protein